MTPISGERVDEHLHWYWKGRPEKGIYLADGYPITDPNGDCYTHYPTKALLDSLPDETVFCNGKPVATPVGVGYLEYVP